MCKDSEARKQKVSVRLQETSLGARKGVEDVITDVLGSFYLCHMPHVMACFPGSGTWTPILRVNASLSPPGSFWRKCP